jgi:hypothetical protein
VLTGCASVTVDSEVNAFSKLSPTAVVNSSYRFEVLPSQQIEPARQAKVEGAAQVALQKVGLTRNDRAARYSVQIGVRSAEVLRGAYPGYWDHGLGGFSGFGRFGDPYWRSSFYGPGFYPGFGFHSPFYPSATSSYRHEVTLLLRDVASQQVVFETKAVHEGFWRDTERLLPALLEAALRDFPNPPRGARQIEVSLPS